VAAPIGTVRFTVIDVRKLPMPVLLAVADIGISASRAGYWLPLTRPAGSI